MRQSSGIVASGWRQRCPNGMRLAHSTHEHVLSGDLRAIQALVEALLTEGLDPATGADRLTDEVAACCAGMPAVGA